MNNIQKPKWSSWKFLDRTWKVKIKRERWSEQHKLHKILNYNYTYFTVQTKRKRQCSYKDDSECCDWSVLTLANRCRGMSRKDCLTNVQPWDLSWFFQKAFRFYWGYAAALRKIVFCLVSRIYPVKRRLGS